MQSHDAQAADLLRSAKGYARYKVMDGFVSVVAGDDTQCYLTPPQSGPTLGDEANMLGGGDQTAHCGSLDWNETLYAYLKRWLQANGREALTAMLEDIAQFTTIRQPQSRERW